MQVGAAAQAGSRPGVEGHAVMDARPQAQAAKPAMQAAMLPAVGVVSASQFAACFAAETADCWQAAVRLVLHALFVTLAIGAQLGSEKQFVGEAASQSASFAEAAG